MKKRLISMLLVLTMMLSLVACGSKKDKVKDAKNIVEVLETVQDAKVTGAKLSLSINGIAFATECYWSGDDKALLNMTYGDKYVTEVIYINDLIYVDVAAVAKFVDEYMVENGGEAEFESALKQYGITEKYIYLTVDELLEYADVSDSADEMEMLETTSVDRDKIIDAFIGFAADFSKPLEFDEDVVKFTGDYVEIRINSGNVEAILMELKKADFKGAFQGLSDAFEKIDFFKNMEDFEPIAAEKVEEAGVEYLEELNYMLENIDSFKEMKPEFELGFGVKDGNVIFKFKGSYEEWGEKYDLIINVETVSKEKNIKAPENAYKFSEFMEGELFE